MNSFEQNTMHLYGRYDGYKNILALTSRDCSDQAFNNAVYEISCAAENFALHGNVIRAYLCLLIIKDENPFSLSCEKRKLIKGGAYSLALSDAKILRKLFFFDFKALDRYSVIKTLENYSSTAFEEKTIDKAIGEMACELSAELEKTSDSKAFVLAIARFYEKFGAGSFGLNKAFTVVQNGSGFSLEPIKRFSDVTLDDLWGYELQKQQLCANTTDFVKGRSANNVLLYGAAGTGKSTSVKAILNEYWQHGLRIVEVTKYQFNFLADIIASLRDRNYRFIIYIDDLSFEDFEIEYKYLKSVIEGGLQPKPSNVLIYATSNRRHLIKETWKDRNDTQADIHHSDTVQEKLSLSERFGVKISFMKPIQKEYQQIVLHLAKRKGVNLPEDELLDMARVWELRHGGMSGRIATQFIDSLCAHTNEENDL